MKVEVSIDSSCTEPKIVIHTARLTEEISQLVEKLSAKPTPLIPGFQEDMVTLLEPADIIRIYGAEGKVFSVTEQGEYRLNLRLYELEERLEGRQFVRISNSEIINLKKVRSFDLGLTGTICVALSNQSVTYVSRRYVSKIKQVLGV